MNGLKLHHFILAAMVLGAITGLALNQAGEVGYLDRQSVLLVANTGEFVGRVFLMLLQMVVVPLVFSGIVTAIVGVGDRGIGRLGSLTLGYYALTSVLAIATGLLVVDIVRPGDGLDYAALLEAARGELAIRGIEPTLPEPRGLGAVLADITTRIIPDNPIHAASSNRTILGLVFFAVLFSVFTVRVGGEAQRRIGGFFEAVYEVMTAMVHALLWLAPVGIAGYLLFVTASTGLQLAGQLMWYLAAVFLGLGMHMFITLPLILWVFGGRDPVAYFLALEEALTTAFSTASSAGTLPVTLDCTRRAGVPEEVATFTLPLGATVNMDGTALYEVVAVLFVAQMLGDLSVGSQLAVALTALAVSVGAAGIPHAGTVMMVVVFDAAGIDSEAVLLLLAVDRVADMGRTAVNVWSDAVGAAVISKWV